MLYVVQVQTDVEDSSENLCDVAAICSDRAQALAKSKEVALAALKHLERSFLTTTCDIEDEVRSIATHVGYRVVAGGCWYVIVTVVEVEDVDLGSHHD